VPISTLRIGILGTARIAERRVVPAMRHAANAVAAGIAGRDARRAQAYAERLGIPKAYGSYEMLLDDPDVDAVYIPLPNALHCEWTIKAAEKGKHVLCEKPFAANAGEVDEMIAACEAHGVVLMEAFMYRFHPQNVQVIELIRLGAIGAVKLVRAAFCFTLGPETNIRLNPALAGGSLLDAGTYCVSAARMLIGAEPERALAIAQVGASGVDETMAGLLQFPGPRPPVAGTAALDTGGVLPAGPRPPVAGTPSGRGGAAAALDTVPFGPTGKRPPLLAATPKGKGVLPAGPRPPVAGTAALDTGGVLPAGALASFECSFRMPYRAVYEVIGERGRIEVPAPFITNNKETTIVLHHPDERTQTFSFPAVDQYTLMIEHFAACVLEHLPLRYPPAEGRAQMQALDALAKSARTGQVEMVQRQSTSI
jgi:predicted dehydrogenase